MESLGSSEASNSPLMPEVDTRQIRICQYRLWLGPHSHPGGQHPSVGLTGFRGLSLALCPGISQQLCMDEPRAPATQKPEA